MFDSVRLGLIRLLVRSRGLLELPPYKGSVLRGGFGSAFRRIACPQRAESCDGCLLREPCPYSYVFETSPPAGAEVLRTFRDVPRPFVLEEPGDGLTEYRKGEELAFGLVTIGRAVDLMPYFVSAFRELGRTGLGSKRTGFDLVDVREASPSMESIGEWAAAESLLHQEEGGWPRLRATPQKPVGREVIRRMAEEIPRGQARISFRTMTRLKSDDALGLRPSFEVLVRTLLRRTSSVAYFHHGQQLDLDYSGIIQAAKEVRVVEDTTRWSSWLRYSNRQDRRMDLGGFTGDVVVRGELDPFRELLALGSLLHVGKNTTFGLGKFVVGPG